MRPGDIRLTARRCANLIAGDRPLRSFAIEFGDFILCVKLTGDPRRSFQRHHQFDAPNTLEIRLAPGRLKRSRVRPRCRGLAFQRDRGQPEKNEHAYNHCQCADDLERSFAHFTSPFISSRLKKPRRWGGSMWKFSPSPVSCQEHAHSLHSNTFSDATTAGSLMIEV